MDQDAKILVCMKDLLFNNKADKSGRKSKPLYLDAWYVDYVIGIPTSSFFSNADMIKPLKFRFLNFGVGSPYSKGSNFSLFGGSSDSLLKISLFLLI